MIIKAIKICLFREYEFKLHVVTIPYRRGTLLFRRKEDILNFEKTELSVI
jgi:hypothetical protein